MSCKEIRVRNVSEEIFIQLKMISDKYGYTSFNQFMLDQLQLIAVNDGLNAYQNKFVETLNEIKLNQKKIIEQQLKNEVAMVGLDAKQDLIKDLTLDWLSFMDDVDALAAERSAGGE
jgi:putative uncharacterized protein gbs0381